MEKNKTVEDFGTFQKHQKELADILGGAAAVTRTLKMSKERELVDLSGKVQNDTFKIMVTGTFKNGKSTFINALLGEEILPAYALPCTAVINEVKYGEEKRAILYFRDPLPDPLPDKLAEKAVRHMERYKGRPIPPMEIPYDEIEDYVVIPMDCSDEKQMKLQSPYAKVELFYPLKLLKNGVEIIDSPGLNEDETRTRVTMDYLSSVDAILYVLNASAICAGDEMEFVENDLQGNKFDSVFFVVNRFDQIRPREQPQIRQYAEMKLKAFYPEPEMFCLSALKALDGRLDGDEEMVEGSGIYPLEKRLAEFLTKEKGRAKLAQPAKKVRQILSSEALERVIPGERALLESSLDDVKARYENLKPRLEMLTAEKKQRQSEMNMRIERSGRKFERMAKSNISDLISSVPVWLEEFTPQTDLGALPSKKKTQQVLTELTDHVKEKVRESQNDWKRDVLQPVIEEEAEMIFQSAERDISRIYAEIDEIRVGLSGNEGYDANPVPFWQRAVGVAGGLAIGDIGLAISGGVNGIGKELAKTAAFELGAGFVLGLLGILNPFTLGAVIIAVFLGNLGRGSSRALAKLKGQVTDAVIAQMGKEADDRSAALADGIQVKFREVSDQIIGSVSGEITDIDEQMKSVMKEMEQGQKNVNARKAQLAECEKKIHSLNGRLDALIFTLVGA